MQTLVENNTPSWIIQAEVTDTISVSDAEIATYFEAHRAELGEVPRVTFREIVLLNEGKDKAQVAERARTVVADARSGVDFAELVSAISESPSKEGGGLVGPLAQADLAPWLGGPAFALGEGEVSDPIETPYGWQIIRVEERSAGAEPDIESLRGEIENRLRQEKFEPALSAYISELWASSEIIIAKDWVHRLPPRWQGKVVQR
jgi:parvulin-like peptidyl-prolyl isomerase